MQLSAAGISLSPMAKAPVEATTQTIETVFTVAFDASIMSAGPTGPLPTRSFEATAPKPPIPALIADPSDPTPDKAAMPQAQDLLDPDVTPRSTPHDFDVGPATATPSLLASAKLPQVEPDPPAAQVAPPPRHDKIPEGASLDVAQSQADESQVSRPQVPEQQVAEPPVGAVPISFAQSAASVSAPVRQPASREPVHADTARTGQSPAPEQQPRTPPVTTAASTSAPDSVRPSVNPDQPTPQLMDTPPSSEGIRVDRPLSTTVSPTVATIGTDSTLAQIRGQIAAVAITTDGRLTEIRLDPAELGRVRITLEVSDGHVTAHVSPDRPDVLDLLRRHADMLTRDLLASGFDSAQMSFGDGTTDAPPGNVPLAQGDDATQPTERHITIPSDRLDLRL